MMKGYLRLIGDTVGYSDSADYTTWPPFAAPSGYEWVQGDLPEGVKPYYPQSPLDKMKKIVDGVDAATRAQFATTIASVGFLLNTGDTEAARIVIQNLQLPENLQPLISQLISCLPS